MEITIKIDEQNKQARALIEYIKTLPFVQLTIKEESNYAPDFIAKINQAETEESLTVDPENLWKSLGLK